MEKCILSPLNVKGTEQMNIFFNKLKDSTRLYIVAGKPKVGKTAFIFKLFNFISSQEEKYPPTLFIKFDKTIEYWQNQLFNSDLNIPKSISFKRWSPKNNKRFSTFILDQIVKNKFKLLVIDGIYLSSEYKDKKVMSEFKIELMDLACSLKIPILLTERRTKPKLLTKKILHSQRPFLPETWFIERPQYYSGEITKGDSRIYTY